MLRVSLLKGLMRFGKKGKPNSQYVGLFPIIERIGPVAYRLALSDHLQRIHNVLHVPTLRRFFRDEVAYQNIYLDKIDLEIDVSNEEKPIAILERRERRLRSKVVSLVSCSGDTTTR